MVEISKMHRVNRGENMKSIGIVVCNYNKEEYIINCLNSIFMSDIEDFDVFVVDNASTDQSVEKITETFQEKLQLIVNDKNLGGSGGFNTGIQKIIQQKYKYLMCVDNDVVFDVDTIRVMKEFLEQHKEVGMVGSKICYMDEPERIQTYGAIIDFEKYQVQDLYRGYLDNAELPKVQYCDYVPACSLMTRVDIVKKIGTMPEDNFIYWDDMEWGYCFKKAGYKVAALFDSRVLHKGGGSVSTSTFNKYYMFRNRMNFFMKYLKEEDREKFAGVIIKELYRSICGSYLKKDYNMVKTFMYAYNDAINGVRGVAESYKILPRQNLDRFQALMLEDKHVTVIFHGDYYGLTQLKNKLLSFSLKNKIKIETDIKNLDEVIRQYPDCSVIEQGTSKKSNCDDVVFYMCDHIFQNNTCNQEYIYVDRWMNLISNDVDRSFCINYSFNEDFFVMYQKCLLLAGMKEREE